MSTDISRIHGTRLGNVVERLIAGQAISKSETEEFGLDVIMLRQFMARHARQLDTLSGYCNLSEWLRYGNDMPMTLKRAKAHESSAWNQVVEIAARSFAWEDQVDDRLVRNPTIGSHYLQVFYSRVGRVFIVVFRERVFIEDTLDDMLRVTKELIPWNARCSHHLAMAGNPCSLLAQEILGRFQQMFRSSAESHQELARQETAIFEELKNNLKRLSRNY